MVVVYSVPSPTSLDMAALNASISSVYANGAGVERVVYVGTPPPSLAAPVEKFHVSPLFARGAKNDNVMDALLRAIYAGVLSGEVLLAPIDFVLESKTDMNSYPIVFSHEKIRTIEDVVVAGKGAAVVTRHKVALSDTRKLLERNGLPTVDFSGSGFLSRIDVKHADKVKEMWLQCPHGAFGYDVPSLFQNVRISTEKTDVVKVEDLAVSV